MFSRCAGCSNTGLAEGEHHERKLARRYELGHKVPKGHPKFLKAKIMCAGRRSAAKETKGRRIRGVGHENASVQETEFEAGKLSEVDYLKDVLNTNIPDGPALREAFAKGSF